MGKWVRGLRPKRRQLPLYHLSLPPELSRSPSLSLRGIKVTVGEGPLRDQRIGLCSSTSQVCENASKNIYTPLVRSFEIN